ncbi:helix-turn-helix transcriptional regulator [Nocardia sp. NPDC051030]|uniref:helix-turn-helix domain-containing protein n=1 Tax=Nocardia sp. NPDC051030 TaxID=3155162 RepID=UPI00341B468F
MPDLNSTLPLRQLGRYLREWRTQAGYSLDRAGELLESSGSALQRIEKGQKAKLKKKEVGEICDLYQMPDDLKEAMIGLAQQAANKSGWWHSYGDLIANGFDVYMGLEAAAHHLSTYQGELIPGLFQTPEYDLALIVQKWPDSTEAERDRRVQIKQRRQHILHRKSMPTKYDAVISEAALHRVAGNGLVMAAQCRRLADLSTMDNISLRILPFGAGFPDGTAMPPFVAIDFGTDSKTGVPLEPPLVFLEGVVGSMYLEKQSDIELFLESYQLIRATALTETASRDLVRHIAKEHEKRGLRTGQRIG